MLFSVINVDSHDAYPGYEGDLDVEGSVSLNLYDDSVVIHYDVTGVDAACESGPTEGTKSFLKWKKNIDIVLFIWAGNSCGLHFHFGNSCEDASTIGGHFHNLSEDPWANVV